MVSVSFAKLVATPTDTSWSQVYNAGNLFACLSLSKEEIDETQLNQTGHDMFSHLESEFFTLENKDLQTIKEAIANSTHIFPSEITANLCLVYIKNNILYVFIYGAGAVILKRGDQVGPILENKSGGSIEILSASGFLKQNDTIVLQTPQFAEAMSDETISSALDLNLPNDIAEALSPAMHEKDDGGQAAIIIRYQEIVKPADEKSDDFNNLSNAPEEISASVIHAEIEDEDGNLEILDLEQKEKIEPAYAIDREEDLGLKISRSRNLPQNFLLTLKELFERQKTKINLNHKNKLYLSIAAIIVVLLLTSIIFTKKKQDDTKTQALFHTVYDPALKDYEDGVGVQSINKEFAHSDFLKAQQTLNDSKDKFKKGSNEEKQISDLLSKVNSQLGGAGSSSKITPKEAHVSDTDLLSIEKSNSGIAFTQNKDTVNMLTDVAVVSIDSSGKKKDLIKNDSDWEKGVGIAAYQGNIYILDQKNGVLKYTAGSDGFGKSSYLKDKPDLSSASAIAIDGSVWILLKNGTILKYTRGVSDGYSIKGLDKEMSGASRIFTNLDTENLYVLDNGNSRIVKINKEGGYQTSYVADILKVAKDLEVSEKDGKITVLSGNKIWEISL